MLSPAFHTCDDYSNIAFFITIKWNLSTNFIQGTFFRFRIIWDKQKSFLVLRKCHLMIRWIYIETEYSLAYIPKVGSCDLHPVCVLVPPPPPPINFKMAEPIFIKLYMYFMATEPISVVYCINPSTQSVCLYV